MKIRKLAGDIIVHMPVTTVSNNKKELFYNIKHGSLGTHMWVYTVGLDSKFFKPKDLQDTIKLQDNDYSLVPVKKAGKILRDKKNNIMYFITKDFTSTHNDDIILFWEIPNNNYKDVKYSIEGKVFELGTGITGKNRGDEIFTSPAPVLEITGDCTLKWNGVDLLGNLVSKEITYTNGEFSTVVKEEEDE